jgi:hypothetical protein
MINIKDGNGIKLVFVDRVDIIETDEYVYTFGVPGVHNYISDDIISHNDGFWDYFPAITQTGQSFSSAAGEVVRIINIATNKNIRFRYSLQFAGSSGFRQNIGSGINSYSTQIQRHTVGPNLSTISPTYDTQLSIAVPSNFVEMKAGGIQVVSDPTTYIRIPRRAADDTNPDIFTAEGGTSYFNAGTYNTSAIITTGNITTETDSLYDIGTSSKKWKEIFTDKLTGLGTKHQSHVVESTTDTTNFQKLADGSILQWGHISDTSAPRTVIFPVTFSSPPSVTCSTYRELPGALGTNHIYNLTNSSVDLILDGDNGYWIACGYIN